MEIAIAPEVMASYRRTALAREAARQQEAQCRRQAARSVARRAARVLTEAFGATQVIAFGSLVHGAWFGPRSDIDLAVAGVPAEAFWHAWRALDRLNPAFEIDLVAIESAPERLHDEIMSQGIAL